MAFSTKIPLVLYQVALNLKPLKWSNLDVSYEQFNQRAIFLSQILSFKRVFEGFWGLKRWNYPVLNKEKAKAITSQKLEYNQHIFVLQKYVFLSYTFKYLGPLRFILGPRGGSRPPYWEPLVYIMIILRLDSNGTFQKHPRSSSLLCSALLKICGYFIFDESHAKLLRADEPGIPRHRASGQFSK